MRIMHPSGDIVVFEMFDMYMYSFHSACMDRRHLHVAFFQYALLRVAVWCPKYISVEKLDFHEGLSKTLMNVTPQGFY